MRTRPAELRSYSDACLRWAERVAGGTYIATVTD